VSRDAVVLDACVLVPIALAETLLRFGEAERYQPLWSARILAEASDAVVEIHPEIPPERVHRRFAAINEERPEHVAWIVADVCSDDGVGRRRSTTGQPPGRRRTPR
jgi:hypothetical protein